MNRRKLLIYAVGVTISAVLCAQARSISRKGFDLHSRFKGSGEPIVFLAGVPGFKVDNLLPLL